MQHKLDSFSWKANSCTVSIDPELELWLWHTESSIRKCWNLSEQQMNQWIEDGATSLKRSIAKAKKDTPKEFFEFLIKKKVKRTISPRDFELMGPTASIPALMECDSFQEIIQTLRGWFPPLE